MHRLLIAFFSLKFLVLVISNALFTNCSVCMNSLVPEQLGFGEVQCTSHSNSDANQKANEKPE